MERPGEVYSAKSDQSHQLAAIMFTDIVGYTTLMDEDEDKAFDLLEKNRQLQRPFIEKYNGKWLKEIGDGILASFATTSEAVYCAKEIIAAANKDANLSLRIGLHQGEVIFKDGDVFGSGVNIASRIQELASINSIWISEPVYRNITNKKDINTEFIAEQQLKHVKEPIKIYEVKSKKVETTFQTRPIDEKPKIIATNKRMLILGAVAVVITAFFGWWYFGPRFGVSDSYTLGESRIAVLPFENKTNDPSLEVLGSMVADWTIQGLMSLDDVRVVSFQTIQDNIKHASASNLGTFGDLTGADKIIRGNYYLQGDLLSFNSQLIDVQSGEIELALPTIKGSRDNIEAVVEEVRDRLLTILAFGDALDSEIIKQNPPRYQAYEYYLKGLELFGADYEESRKMMIKAISIDSSFYRPLAFITISYHNQENFFKADSIFKLYSKYIDDLSKIDRLWYDLGRAMIYGDFNDQYPAISKLFQIDPYQFEYNYQMGLTTTRSNKPQEAVQHFSYLNPANLSYRFPIHVWWSNVYAYNLIRLKRFDEAIAILDYVPSEVSTGWYYQTLLAAYVFNGNDDKLAPALKKMENGNFSNEDITWQYVNILRYYLLTGNENKYEEWSVRAIERIDTADGVSDLFRAEVYYNVGAYEKAINLYKKTGSSEPLIWWQLIRIGCSYARSGMHDEAIRIISELEESIDQDNEWSQKYAMATIYTSLGEKDMAVALLRESFDAGFGFGWFNYDLDPDLLPLHGYPPFEEFVRPKE